MMLFPKLNAFMLSGFVALALLVTGCQTTSPMAAASARTEATIATDVCELFELKTKLTDDQIEAYRRAYAAYCEGL